MRFWLFLFLLMGCAAWAQEDYEISYLLVRQRDGLVLDAREEEKLRTPASTMKVVTAAAALERLGPDHRYRTTLWTASQIRKAHLKGPIILRGDADPELSAGSLEEMAKQVADLGIRWVDGDLLFDEGPNSDPPYGPGWAWDDAGEDFSPEVSGLAIDGGVVKLSPDAQAAWLRHEPGAPPAVLLIPGREGVIVRGDIPKEIAPPRSAQRAGEMFRGQLERYGIKVRGNVRPGRAEGQEIAACPSRPLREILKQALAQSDNLALELVHRSSGGALPQVLQGQRLRRADGSGLSRYNLISARQLVDVLRSQPDLGQLLPTGGEGTLSTRFLQGPAAGQVRAKTGTLGNVSALAGYLFPGSPEECVFAVMINGHVGTTAERKSLEDSLVQSWASRFAGPR
jgi:D-alanyl-D-alanine carboxypeptidase/D-alanyl-D-alanine-endopeptidase (penicillin-binding protein 4)